MAFMNLNENITPYQFEPCVSDRELDKSDDESVVFVEEVDEETFVENNLTNRTVFFFVPNAFSSSFATVQKKFAR